MKTQYYFFFILIISCGRNSKIEINPFNDEWPRKSEIDSLNWFELSGECNIRAYSFFDGYAKINYIYWDESDTLRGKEINIFVDTPFILVDSLIHKKFHDTTLFYDIPFDTTIIDTYLTRFSLHRTQSKKISDKTAQFIYLDKEKHSYSFIMATNPYPDYNGHIFLIRLLNYRKINPTLEDS